MFVVAKIKNILEICSNRNNKRKISSPVFSHFTINLSELIFWQNFISFKLTPEAIFSGFFKLKF
jgi:hypothetical protein